MSGGMVFHSPLTSSKRRIDNWAAKFFNSRLKFRKLLPDPIFVVDLAFARKYIHPEFSHSLSGPLVSWIVFNHPFFIECVC